MATVEISSEDRAAIDRAFPETVDSVYIVHTGSYTGKNERGLAGAVCTRLREADAKGVAQALNQSQEGVLFLKWAASACFPNACGGYDELLEAGGTPEVMQKWEDMAAKHRKDIYMVAHVKLANAKDAQTLARELSK